MSQSKPGKRWKQQEKTPDKRLGIIALSGLVLLSGFAGLVYQVLWVRHLGLLFGNGAQAAAATLAMFFAGLGAGSWWWGRRSSEQPLRLYALLELGIVASAVIYFGVRMALAALYPVLYGALGATLWLLLAKLVMAGLLVFPAAFFMGGTIPAMAQVAVRQRSRFGWISAWLYGVNTLGAMLGVVIGAFLLLPAMGLRLSYASAVACSLLVAVLAWRGSQAERAHQASGDAEEERGSGRLDPLVAALAFVSGFVVLALEVAWTRIFAQVHENSVYSYAVMLAVVLFGLAVGAAISSLLARINKPPKQLLMVVMLVAGSLLVLGPTLLMKATDGLEPVHDIESWGQYVRGLFKMGFAGVGYPVIALGVIFPFLMKMAERNVAVPGRMLGRLLAINTLGAIAGSLVCGFLLLPALGMWSTLRALTLIHLLAALLIPLGWKGPALAKRGVAVALLVLLFLLHKPADLPILGQPADQQPAKLLAVWEASDCTVTVVKQVGGARAILINAGYSLGSTAAYVEQANQSRIPLQLYPKTRSICYIGIGTGMSVGASLDRQRFPNVERVVACELSAAVVEAAREWIPEHLNGGMFSDPRCEIRVEDGRHHLMATRERFDMINADLFLPYRRGAGSLYSLDHYEVVTERLNPGGVFVQWLPLYQLTEFEFGVIARTMLEAFDEVTLWRNNFAPGQEKVALVGRRKGGALAILPAPDAKEMRAVLGRHWRQTSPDMVQVEPESMPFFYGGNLSRARGLFEHYPLNTDDRPVIEFQTPWRFREVAQKDEVIWCVGPKLTQWMERLLEVTPPAEDPHFDGHPPHAAHFVKAGMAFHQAMVAKALGQYRVTQSHWVVFLREWALAATPDSP